MTRRASRLFQEHMKLLVLGEAGCAALKACYQVYYCPDADSMAASHGDDIIAEGEPQELDRLDEVSKRLVVAEVPDRIQTRSGGTRPVPEEACRAYRRSGPRKHLAAIIRNRSKVGANRISVEGIPKRWTNWRSRRRSCTSKTQV